MRFDSPPQPNLKGLDGRPVIAVAHKWAPNPADATASATGEVDWSRARRGLSEDDPAAIALARSLADAVGAGVVGFTVGGPEAATPAARKAVLARGLDRLVAIAEPAAADVDALTTAAALASLVEREPRVDLLVTGATSMDTGAGIVGALVAARLGWPCIVDATSVAWADDEVTITRPGDAEPVTVTRPAVVACAPGLPDPGQPGMRDIMSAARKPAQVAPLPTLATPRPAEIVARRRTPEPPRQRHLIDGSDPESAADEAVAWLTAADALKGGQRRVERAEAGAGFAGLPADWPVFAHADRVRAASIATATDATIVSGVIGATDSGDLIQRCHGGLVEHLVRPVGPAVIVLDASVATRDSSAGDVRTAATVVGAGRGVAEADAFALVAELAEALDASLACSRPLVGGPLGFTNDQCIGQSGLDIGPELYVAVGTSGQFQHMVGVRQAGTIVAINRDPASPVFGVCDLGLVGDLREIVPALVARLRH